MHVCALWNSNWVKPIDCNFAFKVQYTVVVYFELVKCEIVTNKKMCLFEYNTLCYVFECAELYVILVEKIKNVSGKIEWFAKN